MASPAQPMTAAAPVPFVDEQQKHWHQQNDENAAVSNECHQQPIDQHRQQRVGRRRWCRCRRSFTIAPIDGMEWMQKCYPTYGVDGDMAAKRFLEEKKVNLSRRFQLISRGYVLKMKEEANGDGDDCCGCKGSLFDQLTVRLFTGHDACGRDGDAMGMAKEMAQQREEEDSEDEQKMGAAVDQE